MRGTIQVVAGGAPYTNEELADVVKPLLPEYKIERQGLGEGGGDVFSANLYLVIPASLAAGGVVIKPWVEGAAKKLGEAFAALLLKKFNKPAPESPDEITLTIINYAPEGDALEQVQSGFGIRAEVKIATHELARPEQLKAKVSTACDLIEESNTRLWEAIREKQLPVKATFAKYDSDLQHVHLRFEKGLSSPIYGADLRSPGELKWQMLAPDVLLRRIRGHCPFCHRKQELQVMANATLVCAACGRRMPYEVRMLAGRP